MRAGEIVARKSYGKDILFKIIEVVQLEKSSVCVLKGLHIRIMADSPAEDLEILCQDDIMDLDRAFNKKLTGSINDIISARFPVLTENKKKERFSKRISREEIRSELSFGRPGKVLHIDSDEEYLTACLKAYKQLSIEAVGKVIAEKNQSGEISALLKASKPDILVITGHDSIAKDVTNYVDINNYKNSKYFVEAVNEARSYEPDYDKLVIFAGACQSCYEALLDAGANFASSPNRILIHCLDPVFVAESVAYTNIEKVLSLQEAVKNCLTGVKGIGGLQTRGKYREGYPKSLYI